ncbi:MAG: zinc ribbon domain-containing protein [Candidatus Kerfeldbacteria bacterium]|nr:zinc ribbon domain-containing protein [Candidatus Kerfeldbacteria bacterium]
MDEQKYKDICQSCAMPMEKFADYGTNQDESQNYEFCTHCYQKGAFTQPNISMEQMINGCIGIMVQYGMSEEEAKAQIEPVIPTLKRWKK